MINRKQMKNKDKTSKPYYSAVLQVGIKARHRLTHTQDLERAWCEADLKVPNKGCLIIIFAPPPDFAIASAVYVLLRLCGTETERSG